MKQDIIKLIEQSNFKLRPYQKYIIEKFKSNEPSIIIKARQLGFTTLSAQYAAHYAMYSDQIKIVYVCHSTFNINYPIKNIEKLIKENNMFVEFSSDKQNIYLQNGSQIIFMSESQYNNPTYKIYPEENILILDEFAWIGNYESILETAIKSQETKKLIAFTSIPNAVAGNKRLKTFHDSHKEQITIIDHGERTDESWRKTITECKNNITNESFAAEYECKFQ